MTSSTNVRTSTFVAMAACKGRNWRLAEGEDARELLRLMSRVDADARKVVDGGMQVTAETLAATGWRKDETAALLEAVDGAEPVVVDFAVV